MTCSLPCRNYVVCVVLVVALVVLSYVRSDGVIRSYPTATTLLYGSAYAGSWFLGVFYMESLYLCLCITCKVRRFPCVVPNLVHRLPFDKVLEATVKDTTVHNCLYFSFIVLIGE